MVTPSQWTSGKPARKQLLIVIFIVLLGAVADRALGRLRPR